MVENVFFFFRVANVSNFEVTGVSAGGKRLYLELSTEVVGSDLSLVLRAKLCDPNFLDCSRAVDVAKGLRFSTDCQPGRHSRTI